MTPVEQVKAIQAILGVTQDGDPGPQTKGAFQSLCETVETMKAYSQPSQGFLGVHAVKASSFADPADLAAYNRAIAEGKTQQEAFKVGDNCIGEWGTFTGDVNGPPMCALPPEDWEPKWGDTANGRRVDVTINGKTVTAELRDSMPHRAHITNGAGIDMNPALCKAFGLTPPVMVDATWQWS